MNPLLLNNGLNRTPDTKAGKIAELIMDIFSGSHSDYVRLNKGNFNKVWDHVLKTLESVKDLQ